MPCRLIPLQCGTMIFRQSSAGVALFTPGPPRSSVPFLAIRKTWRFSVLGKLRFVHPLFSWSYELLFPQALSFDNTLRCPPGVGGSSLHPPALQPVNALNAFLTRCCELFVHSRKLKLFVINQIHILLTKHRGWGWGRLSRLPYSPARYHFALISPRCYHEVYET